MGIVHATCQLTGLGIVSSAFANVRAVIVAEAGGTFQPIALPIYGDYNDYGNIEKPALLDGDRAIVKGVLEMHARGELWWSDTAEITTDVSEANLVAILEEIRQGMIYEAVRYPEKPSLMMRANGMPIHFVYILDHFYDKVVAMQKAALSAEQKEHLDEALEGPFEPLAGVLGVPSLSSHFLEDTAAIRDELVELRLFRSWFDSRRTWKPLSTGEQLSRSDLMARVRAARSSLAEWPPLLARLDQYEEQVTAAPR